MPARPSWKGHLRLSLVTVPVKAFTASNSSSGEVRLNQLHNECNSRIQYKKTCPIHGEVSTAEIVSGYEYSKGSYVKIDPECAGLDHVRDWVHGTPEGDWVSMGIASDGSYGIAEGLMYSFPVTVSGGTWSIVQGLDVDEFSREKMAATRRELEEEREAVKDLL